MARHKKPDTEAIGSDSFLDVVTNIVGILIVLVMLVGIRVKHSLSQTRDAAAAEKISQETSEVADLEGAQRDLAALEADLTRLEDQAQTIEDETLARREERDLLATLAAGIERELADAKAALDVKSRETFETTSALDESRDELAHLADRKQRLAETAEVKKKTIDNYPTPISRTVDGDEVNFQLLDKRLAYIPVESLVEALKEQVQKNANAHLQNRAQLANSVGPIGGFRMKYTLRRREVSLGGPMNGATGSVVTLQSYLVQPISSGLGETLEQALAVNSRFHRVLEECVPGRTTITIWAYPDSFAEFRELKKDLYRRGFPVACRPLPEGHEIGASTQGTRSSAE